MSRTYTTHTYQFPSSPWASALDQHKVSALGSRVSWTPARNNERTNECYWPQFLSSDPSPQSSSWSHRHRPVIHFWLSQRNSDSEHCRYSDSVRTSKRHDWWSTHGDTTCLPIGTGGAQWAWRVLFKFTSSATDNKSQFRAHSIIESGFTLNLISDSLGKSNDFRSVGVSSVTSLMFVYVFVYVVLEIIFCLWS